MKDKKRREKGNEKHIYIFIFIQWDAPTSRIEEFKTQVSRSSYKYSHMYE
jgi:hypothetical protein